VQARNDAEDEIEPVMKAEPEPHHDHPLTPVDRPAPVIPREGPEKEAPRAEADSPPKEAPRAEANGEVAEREPEPVGKSGAQSESDDLR
jgi:membrane protein